MDRRHTNEMQEGRIVVGDLLKTKRKVLTMVVKPWQGGSPLPWQAVEPAEIPRYDLSVLAWVDPVQFYYVVQTLDQRYHWLNSISITYFTKCK